MLSQPGRSSRRLAGVQDFYVFVHFQRDVMAARSFETHDGFVEIYF
jgi:hypothetical protein